MSTIFPVDHHATFQGWAAGRSESKTRTSGWSSRKSVGFIFVTAIVAWAVVLAPFLIFN